MTFHSETLRPVATEVDNTIVSRVIAAIGRAFAEGDRKRRTRREYLALMELSDAHLRDIGLTRADVQALLLGRGTEHLGPR
jgi:uncharacterized protein YjiS (DUF1127 family)